MGPRLAVVACALAALASACTGGGEAAGKARAAVSASPTPPPASKAERAAATKALSAAPLARLHAGVDSEAGVPTVFCRGDECTSLDAAPERYLKIGAGGFVTFSLGRAPEAAHVELTRNGNTSVVPLSPGTLMCLCELPPPGRYDIELVASWKDGKARWAFGLAVARGPAGS